MGSASSGTPDDGAMSESTPANRESDDREKRVPQETDLSTGAPISAASTTSLTRPLTKQISDQVNSLENEAITIENSEVQARVRHLIKLIKTNLQSRTLDKKTQRELARLLSLTPTLDGRHAQQLNLLDLAVSILLEPNGSSSSGSSGSRSGVNSGGAGTEGDDLANAKNLVFVQETRRQIAQQSRPYPDLLRTIFVTGGGTPYIRLISGLGWFFLLFVMTPLTVAGLTFAARDIAGFREAQGKIAELQQIEADLSEETQRQQTQVESLIRRRDSLAAQLGRINSQIAVIASETPDDPSDSQPEANNVPSNTSTGTPSTNQTPTLSTTPSDPAPTAPFVRVLRQDLNTIQTEIEAALRSDLDSSLNSALNSARNRETAASDGAKTAVPNREANSAESNVPASRTESAPPAPTVIDDWIFTTTFSLILLAIAMGALGSTISVIVRANTFIRQAQENDNDLFLTGFFRPFVGMSFAIFCVALVEAGIFSGIFDLTNRKETDRTYFYVAIAFVAGFSERLVRDVVIKTEDSIAGPTNSDNHWS